VAITAARTTGDFAGFLRPDQAAPIFDRAAKVSLVQQLARRIPLGASGVEIPVTTGRMTAGWVAEAGQKPASQGALGIKTMTPKKVAAVAVVSAEVVRANPGGYMDTLRPQIAEAFAVAFDNAALHDAGPDGTAGAGPFATYVDQTTKTVEVGGTAQASGGIHGDINAGLSLLVNGGKRLSGFVFDDRMEPQFNGAVDTTGRPLFIDSPVVDEAGPVRQGRVLGRPARIGPGLRHTYSVTAGTTTTNYEVLGYGGDWSQAAWGVVGGITYDVSTEATVTINGVLTSLWENNMVAIRAEAEYGWLVNDAESFVQYRNTI
jgi:HK97 family phage major capsid protein